MEELRENIYGNSELEVGWFVVGGGEHGIPVDWKAREIPDSVMDLENLARNVVNELEGRFENSFSELNKLLAECFDFARLFAAVCGARVEEKTPVDRKRFSEFGAHEFRKCVQYVSEMPHVKDKNLELGSELSSAKFWREKSFYRSSVGRDVCQPLL